MIDAWLRASENTAIFSALCGILPDDKRDATLPIATITAMLAAKPVGHRRQSYSIKMTMHQSPHKVPFKFMPFRVAR